MIIFLQAKRFSFLLVVLAALLIGAAVPVHALGLGELRVQSGLGQAFKASVNLLGLDVNNVSQSCISAKIESSDGGFLAAANITLNQLGTNKSIQLFTRQGLNEPAIKITMDIACDIQLHREYMVLLDPPQFNATERNTSISLPLVQSTSEPTQSAQELSTPTPRKKRVQPLLPPASNEAAFSKETLRSLPTLSTKTNKAPKKEHKDVLKLSDDSFVLPENLRMSDSLSSPSTEQQSASNLAELRAAQARFAALVRGENVEVESEAQLKARQQKIQALQMEAAQLKKQSQLDKAALDDVKESSFSRNWMIGLSAFIIVGILIIVLLVVYISRLHKRAEFSWWEQNAQRSAESKKNIEDIVNNVQASYDHNEAGTYQTYEMDPQDPQLNAGLKTVEKPQNEKEPVWVGTEPNNQNNQRVVSRPLTLEETNSSTFNFFSTRGSSVKVEEISDVTQEAEFWMSVNDPQRAIEILEPQALIEQPDSPVPWLYLLDLYRATNNQEKYDGLRTRFILFFNANIPGFEDDPSLPVARQLEDFVHLTERICGMWGSNDVLPFLQSLLFDDRNGERMGFELPVYRDILLLIAIAHELERNKALGGLVGSGWNAAHDASATKPAMESQFGKADPYSIDFDTIDFPKKS